jgi:hypothetical protein
MLAERLLVCKFKGMFDVLQVKSWQDHAAKYLCSNMELQATNAALEVSVRHQRFRLED